MKLTFHKIIISVICILLFWGIFLLFQNQTVYNATLGKFADNYEKSGDNIILVHKPYEKLINDNLMHWDAGMYNNIRNNFYNVEISGGDYIYAVFPLFSMIWRISHLTATGIVFLNIIFFIISIILISNLFADQTLDKARKLGLFAVAITFPSVAAFFIPYSESTFLIMSAIALWGLFKNKYWLYFIGMALMAMTRSTILILFFSFLFTNIIYFLKHRNIRFLIFETFKQILPLLIGTLIVSLIQYYYDSGSLLKFIDAQKYWGNKFEMPHNVRDWSHESFGTSVAIIFFIIATAIAYLSLKTRNNFLQGKTEAPSIFKNDIPHIKDYLLHLSIVYSLGIFFFILFFRGGCLYGITRYILCTPFFYIFLYAIRGKLDLVPVKIQMGVWIILTFLSLFFMGLSTYSTYWNFSDLGYVLFVIAVGIWCFYDYFPKNIIVPLISLFVIISTIWITYLFNMFLSDAWICI